MLRSIAFTTIPIAPKLKNHVKTHYPLTTHKATKSTHPRQKRTSLEKIGDLLSSLNPQHVSDHRYETYLQHTLPHTSTNVRSNIFSKHFLTPPIPYVILSHRSAKVAAKIAVQNSGSGLITMSTDVPGSDRYALFDGRFHTSLPFLTTVAAY